MRERTPAFSGGRLFCERPPTIIEEFKWENGIGRSSWKIRAARYRPTGSGWCRRWGWTVSVSLCSLVVALVLGSLVGVIRTLPDSPWLVRLGNAWVELFRNVPLLVQIFLWYHVVPKMFPVM